MVVVLCTVIKTKAKKTWMKAEEFTHHRLEVYSMICPKMTSNVSVSVSVVEVMMMMKKKKNQL